MKFKDRECVIGPEFMAWLDSVSPTAACLVRETGMEKVHLREILSESSVVLRSIISFPGLSSDSCSDFCKQTDSDVASLLCPNGSPPGLTALD